MGGVTQDGPKNTDASLNCVVVHAARGALPSVAISQVLMRGCTGYRRQLGDSAYSESSPDTLHQPPLDFFGSSFFLACCLFGILVDYSGTFTRGLGCIIACCGIFMVPSLLLHWGQKRRSRISDSNSWKRMDSLSFKSLMPLSLYFCWLKGYLLMRCAVLTPSCTTGRQDCKSTFCRITHMRKGLMR
jgi:hypothetical protein